MAENTPLVLTPFQALQLTQGQNPPSFDDLLDEIFYSGITNGSSTIDSGLDQYNSDTAMTIPNINPAQTAAQTRLEIRQTFRQMFAALLQPAWTEVLGGVGFQNAWTNYGVSGFNTAGFRKNTLNQVRLKGLISLGIVGDTAFTLPVGYRPLNTLIFPIITYAPVINTFGQVRIDPSGNVIIFPPSNNTWLSLDSISFDAEQ
jgi:hypothetical protein